MGCARQGDKPSACVRSSQPPSNARRINSPVAAGQHPEGRDACERGKHCTNDGASAVYLVALGDYDILCRERVGSSSWL